MRREEFAMKQGQAVWLDLAALGYPSPEAPVVPSCLCDGGSMKSIGGLVRRLLVSIVGFMAIVFAALSVHPQATAHSSLTTEDSSGGDVAAMRLLMTRVMGGDSMPPVGTAAEHVEARLQSLKTSLQIAVGQLAEWNYFAHAVRSAARHLDLHPDRADAEQESGRIVVGAVQLLYQSLSDDQRTTAESLMISPSTLRR